MKTNKYLQILFFTIIFLVFLKSDYRIINELNCCQDDFDYYSHALTIAQDFDLDYSNQLETNSRFYNKSKDKVAPIGFFGTGLLASPFLFLGIHLDSFFNIEQDILNFKKLLYSFSSIFYLFLSSILLRSIFNNSIKKFPINLVLFGSGILYYSFERYSMTHASEVFSVSLILFISEKYFSQKNVNKLFSFMLPFSILLGFLIRWTNYYIFLIPIIVLLFNKNKLKITKIDYYFVISCLASIGLFLLHTKAIYGDYILSPLKVYGFQNEGSSILTSVSSNLFISFFDFFKDVIIVMFTFEFGIFWISPVIFLGFIVTLFKFIFGTYYEKKLFFVLLICFSQNFFVVSLWNGNASSYGFRYLFSLIPLSIYILYKVDLKKFNKSANTYLILFSVIGILSVLFFETTLQTQLSLTPVENSFGVLKRYSQPDYLIGLMKSFFVIESYLKITATSFLFAILFKLLLLVFDFKNIIQLFENIGLADNTELIDLISKINQIESAIFIAVIIVSVLLVKFVIKARI